MRLAGAGRTVKQQASLEVLSGGQQRFPVAGYPQGMPLHPRQHGVGQDDVSAPDAGRLGEREGDTAHLVQ